jgi:hypothetical protein
MVLGGPLEDLGAPVNDTVVDSDGEHTDYAGGTLYWKTGTYNVYRQDGPVAQRWLSEQASSGCLATPPRIRMTPGHRANWLAVRETVTRGRLQLAWRWSSASSCGRNPVVRCSRGLGGEDVTQLVRDVIRVPVKSRLKIASLGRG